MQLYLFVVDYQYPYNDMIKGSDKIKITRSLDGLNEEEGRHVTELEM